jgi:hypothetical protein
MKTAVRPSGETLELGGAPRDDAAVSSGAQA